MVRTRSPARKSTGSPSPEEPIRSPRPLNSCGVLVVNVGRAAAVNEQARELGWATVEPARSVAVKPIDPPDITELLRSIDASAAPLP